MQMWRMVGGGLWSEPVFVCVCRVCVQCACMRMCLRVRARMSASQTAIGVHAPGYPASEVESKRVGQITILPPDAIQKMRVASKVRRGTHARLLM